MNIEYANGNMYINDVQDFDLSQILQCGQSFRWKQATDGFDGVALSKKVRAEQNGDSVIIYGAEQGEGWEEYFDLGRDYSAIKKQYSKDKYLNEGMSFAQGIRVLNQPLFETLISFIISANNNVKRIMGIVERISEKYGERIGEDAYDFPTAAALANADEEGLKQCGAGYRAPYIIKTARMIESGFPLGSLKTMPYEQARLTLTELCGVGMKVADCVCLYSLGFSQAFPHDVWMNKVLCGVYGYKGKNDKDMRAFVDTQFGENAGIAQQYLFHYARHNPQMICKV